MPVSSIVQLAPTARLLGQLLAETAIALVVEVSASMLIAATVEVESLTTVTVPVMFWPNINSVGLTLRCATATGVTVTLT